MNATPSHPVSRPVARIVLFALCCLTLALAACAGKGVKKDAEAPPVNPNEKKLAYGASIVLPPSWQVGDALGPEVAKASLDSRRASGEHVAIFEAGGAPSASGLPSVVRLYLVNQEGAFMPPDYAEKLQPDEFAALARDLLAQEKAMAKKQKRKDGMLDLQFTRESINGKLAIKHYMLITGPDGKTIRLIRWDIYLPNGAGIAVRSFCDPDSPGAEQEVISTVHSLRVQ